MAKNDEASTAPIAPAAAPAAAHAAGVLSSEARAALIADLKLLRTQHGAAERTVRELAPKLQAVEALLRAYGVDFGSIES